MKRSANASLAIAALVSACDGNRDHDHTPPSDRDGDGVTAEAGDCDDRNRFAFPGASDHPGDGVDQDCDGADARPVPEPAMSDMDRDGVTAEAGDCDDLNRVVVPGAREVSFDGVDSDCDGDELPALGEDRFDEALGLLDTDEDETISLAEFEAACARSASFDGSMRPGVVQTHASCAGVVAGRGMHLHPWRQLFVHDCRAVNHCAAWSCTEMAAGDDRSGEEVYQTAGCTNCHAGTDGAFKLPVPSEADLATIAEDFDVRPDSRLAASIAFGIAGVSPGGVAYANMPGHLHQLSRAELDAVVAWVRQLRLEVAPFVWGDATEIEGSADGEVGDHGGMTP